MPAQTSGTAGGYNCLFRLLYHGQVMRQPPCSNRQSTFRAASSINSPSGFGAKPATCTLHLAAGTSTLTAGLCAIAAAMAGVHSPSMLFAITRAQRPGDNIRPRGVHRGGIFAGGPGAGARLQHGRGGKSVCAHREDIACISLWPSGASMMALPKPPPWPSITTSFNSVSSFLPEHSCAAAPYIKGANSRRNICASHLYSGTRRISSAVTSWHMAMVASKSAFTSPTICPPKNWQQFS